MSVKTGWTGRVFEDFTVGDIYEHPLGRTVTNPVNGEELPMYVADYVLMEYGTGAIMAVPGHDERDFEFATKFGLPIRRVVEGGDELPYSGDGPLANSDPQFDGKNKATEKSDAAATAPTPLPAPDKRPALGAPAGGEGKPEAAPAATAQEAKPEDPASKVIKLDTLRKK